MSGPHQRNDRHLGVCIAGGGNHLRNNATGDVEPGVFAHFASDKIYGNSPANYLNSDFFAAIRSRQPYSQNLLTHCMIIDNPDVYRNVVRS